MPGLNGWHKGERSIQEKLGFAGPVAQWYTNISPDLDEQHREFHSARLPFVPVTTLDNIGRPWGSILAGATGELGFISSPDDTTLSIRAKVWHGDPLKRNAKFAETKPNEPMLVAGIGIEFSTRRRNKFAGYVSRLERGEDMYDIDLTVNEAIGNCPKYINLRDLIPHPNTSPRIQFEKLQIPESEHLPDEVITFIREADTVFIGTTYVAPKEAATRFPSHVGMNQRGGRAGFVRVSPSDGRTVVLPDYSGNRMMTSLGNIEVTPLASLTFVDFKTGDVLYLTGDAENLVRPASEKIMPGQKNLTTVYVTGFTLVRDALPVRQRENTETTRSPYSPPIRLLAEELSASTSFFRGEEEVSALLSRVEIHSPSLATFTWQLSQDVEVKPGQAAILDFSALLGEAEYQHMSSWKPTSVNDDRVRTWTVSFVGVPRGISLTMREKPGGTVTGALFSIVRQLAEHRPELLADCTPLGLSVKLMGIAGDFVLPSEDEGERKLLWAAGGIGITPFLHMLTAISESRTQKQQQQRPWDIIMILSTREPDVLLRLLARALGTTSKSAGQRSRLRLEIYTNERIAEVDHLSDISGWDVEVRSQPGRVSERIFEQLEFGPLEDREVFVCGPEKFETTVLGAVSRTGIHSSKVHREGFGF